MGSRMTVDGAKIRWWIVWDIGSEFHEGLLVTFSHAYGRGQTSRNVRTQNLRVEEGLRAGLEWKQIASVSDEWKPPPPKRHPRGT